MGDVVRGGAKERAARALCRAAGNPENTKFEGQAMWKSYLPEVDRVFSAAGIDELEAALQVVANGPDAGSAAKVRQALKMFSHSVPD